jgi:hypothetical protein
LALAAFLVAAPAVAASSVRVKIHLERVASGGDTISFGVPFQSGAVADSHALRVTSGGAEIPARIEELVPDLDAAGHRRGARAVRVQIAADRMKGPALDLVLETGSPRVSLPGATAVYRSPSVSFDSAEVVTTAARTIVAEGGHATLRQSAPVQRTLFVGREPQVLAIFEPGYLAHSGILGAQMTETELGHSDRNGLNFFSIALRAFAGSALYDEGYPLNPDPDSVPDPKTAYEGWLYDRCATFLLAHVHTGETRFLRAAHRSCSYYAAAIDGRGLFTGKPERDPKYSHARGLYAWYALTGDERAREAGVAIAEMWLADTLFVAPYRDGHTRGPDKLWTERLLAASLEGLYYGHRFTGEAKYLDAFRALFATAHRHITGDRAALAKINPGVDFPPQECFVHSGEQQGDAGPKTPWCSAWMSELLVEPLLRYQEQTGDARVDDVFIALTHFLRDVGTVYFRGNPLDDHFLSPSVCDDPNDHSDRRMLVPLYGAGIGSDGKRVRSGEFDDALHCADATALTAAGLRALKKRGPIDENLMQLHHELAYCARTVFVEQTRMHRDPRTWNSEQLKPGLADPDKFIRAQKIGYPSHAIAPQRRLSWWFNGSLEQFSLLGEAQVKMGALHPGRIPGPKCK